MNEDQTITLPDGRTLGYAEYGDTDGLAVLFFHGWPSSRYQAAYLDGDARERGIRLLAPDRPGLGLSSPLPDRGFADWPADVAAFADALGIDRLLLFGVSGGGPYTLATCAALGDRVERAAVLCGAPPLGDESDRRHMHWVYRTLAGIRSLRRAAMPGILGLSRWMIDRGADRAPLSWMFETIPQVDRDALHTGGGWDMVTRSYLEAMRGGSDAILTDGELYLSPWDFEPESIRVPVRFWHGLADANLPCEVARTLVARIPTAQGTWVEGEGHYSLPVRHSADALDWLATGGGRPAQGAAGTNA